MVAKDFNSFNSFLGSPSTGVGGITEYTSFGGAFRGASTPDEIVRVSWDAGLDVPAGNYVGYIQNPDSSFFVPALQQLVRMGTIDSGIGPGFLIRGRSGVGEAAFTLDADGGISCASQYVIGGHVLNGSFREQSIYLDFTMTSPDGFAVVFHGGGDLPGFARARYYEAVLSTAVAGRNVCGGIFQNKGGPTGTSFKARDTTVGFGTSTTGAISALPLTDQWHTINFSVGKTGTTTISLGVSCDITQDVHAGGVVGLDSAQREDLYETAVPYNPGVVFYTTESAADASNWTPRLVAMGNFGRVL